MRKESSKIHFSFQNLLFLLKHFPFHDLLRHFPPKMPVPEQSHPATRALHADDSLNLVTDVAPPMHLSTTFRFPSELEKLIPSEDPVVGSHPYLGFLPYD